MGQAIFEEGGLKLEICFFKEIDSTQKRLIEDLKSRRVQAPIAYFSTHQTAGVGSRGNSWIGEEGNFFLSFAITKRQLPSDLHLQSLSIYVSYLLKMVLAQRGSKVWIKWPNDFFIEDRKCGGCVTNVVGESFVCGIGLNTKRAPEGFGRVDIAVDERELLEAYFKLLEAKLSWKEIFSNFRVEFHKSRHLYVHIKGERVLLKDAQLAEDGALIIGEERVYSLR